MARLDLGCHGRLGCEPVWYALVTPHEGDTDLPQEGRLQNGQVSAWHSKVESTVRYLGIEVDDALAIAEQVDI